MKYIDAEKLIAEIKRYKNKADNRLKIKGRTFSEEQKDLAIQNLCGNLLHFISSLQQEQPEPVKGKFVFPKYLYARTKDNKTIDMSYAPQDMTAIEYVRNDSVEQEQPEVDLEKELDKYLRGEFKQTAGGNFNNYIQVARHFYELGLNARKEETK